MSDDMSRFSLLRHPEHLVWNENENRKRLAMMDAVQSGNFKPASHPHPESEAMTPEDDQSQMWKSQFRQEERGTPSNPFEGQDGYYFSKRAADLAERSRQLRDEIGHAVFIRDLELIQKAARLEALEEAAKIAEYMATHYYDENDRPKDELEMNLLIAEAIRERAKA